MSLSLLIVIPLACWAALMRAAEGTWLAPGAFFALWWTAAATFPLVVAPEEPVSELAVLWVVAAAVAVGLGSIAGRGPRPTSANVVDLNQTQKRWLTSVLVVSMMLGFGNTVFFVLGHGLGLGTLLRLENYLTFANLVSVARYTGEAPPPLSQAMLPFVYLTPLLGGVLFGESRRWGRVAGLLGVLPAVLLTLVQTAKAAVFFAALLWLAGAFATTVRRRQRLLTWRRTVLAVVAGVAVIPLMYVAAFARLGSANPELMAVANLKLRSALVGHLSVFSQWLQDYLQTSPAPTFGKYVFAGPAEALGLSTRVQGLYETVYVLTFGEGSNIYTAFRAMIEDFTIPGAVAFLLLLGVGAGLMFRAVRHGRWWALPFLTAFYAVTMCSPITWLFVYNSHLAAFAGMLIAVLLTPGLAGRWPSRLTRAVVRDTPLTIPGTQP